MTAPARDERPALFAPIMAALIVLYLAGAGIVVLVGALAGDGSDSSASASASTTAAVSLTEYAIKGDLTVPAGKVTLDVKNAGTMAHQLTVTKLNKATASIAAGASAKLDLGKLTPGDYELYCAIPGHKDSGMVATLTVAAAGSSSPSTSMSMSSSDGTLTADQMAKMDADMLASFAKFPAKTEGVGNQLLPFTTLPDGTKQFELTAEMAKWEVEPGRIVNAYTYNGTVPAPTIKLNVGDKVKVIFHNKLGLNQDIHWHGIQTPFAMDGVAPITQDPVKPGGDFTYEFTVDRPYMGMYHPHLHGVTTVPGGMFGVIQVGDTPIARNVTINNINVPANVKPAVDMPMVLNDAGPIGLSLNGKSFPATAPIVVNEGDWVAVTYYNEGLQGHPMHLHQFPQLVTAQDGFPLASPYWVDTLWVAPGQRFTVMFHADKKGTWVYHCHILSHAERDTGMFGMVTAIVVK